MATQLEEILTEAERRIRHALILDGTKRGDELESVRSSVNAQISGRRGYNSLVSKCSTENLSDQVTALAVLGALHRELRIKGEGFYGQGLIPQADTFKLADQWGRLGMIKELLEKTLVDAEKVTGFNLDGALTSCSSTIEMLLGELIQALGALDGLTRYAYINDWAMSILRQDGEKKGFAPSLAQIKRSLPDWDTV